MYEATNDTCISFTDHDPLARARVTIILIMLYIEIFRLVSKDTVLYSRQGRPF